MSDLDENPEDMFSHDEAHIIAVIKTWKIKVDLVKCEAIIIRKTFLNNKSIRKFFAAQGHVTPK